MKQAVLFVGLLVTSVGLYGCGDPNAGEDPAAAPKVEYKSMEDAGVKSPEDELKELRERDQRPAEDKGEGGM